MDAILSMELTLGLIFMTLSRENLTSAAVILLPSWKRTSFLRLNCQVLLSSRSQDVASAGFSEKSSFAPTSVSKQAAFSQRTVPSSAGSIESIAHISPSTRVLSFCCVSSVLLTFPVLAASEELEVHPDIMTEHTTININIKLNTFCFFISFIPFRS